MLPVFVCPWHRCGLKRAGLARPPAAPLARKCALRALRAVWRQSGRRPRQAVEALLRGAVRRDRRAAFPLHHALRHPLLPSQRRRDWRYVHVPQHTDNSTTRPGPLQCAQTFPGWLVACVATILEAVHDMRHVCVRQACSCSFLRTTTRRARARWGGWCRDWTTSSEPTPPPLHCNSRSLARNDYPRAARGMACLCLATRPLSSLLAFAASTSRDRSRRGFLVCLQGEHSDGGLHTHRSRGHWDHSAVHDLQGAQSSFIHSERTCKRGGSTRQGIATTARARVRVCRSGTAQRTRVQPSALRRAAAEHITAPQCRLRPPHVAIASHCGALCWADTCVPQEREYLHWSVEYPALLVGLALAAMLVVGFKTELAAFFQVRQAPPARHVASPRRRDTRALARAPLPSRQQRSATRFIVVVLSFGRNSHVTAWLPATRNCSARVSSRVRAPGGEAG